MGLVRGVGVVHHRPFVAPRSHVRVATCALGPGGWPMTRPVALLMFRTRHIASKRVTRPGFFDVQRGSTGVALDGIESAY